MQERKAVWMSPSTVMCSVFLAIKISVFKYSQTFTRSSATQRKDTHQLWARRLALSSHEGLLKSQRLVVKVWVPESAQANKPAAPTRPQECYSLFTATFLRHNIKTTSQVTLSNGLSQSKWHPEDGKGVDLISYCKQPHGGGGGRKEKGREGIL